MDFKFLPKPFTFSNYIVDDNGYTPVSNPKRTCHINCRGERECVCVHVCKNFQEYPTVKYGIKCIPENAPCDFSKDGICHGNMLVRNGKIMHLRVPFLAIRVDMVRSIAAPER